MACQCNLQTWKTEPAPASNDAEKSVAERFNATGLGWLPVRNPLTLGDMTLCDVTEGSRC